MEVSQVSRITSGWLSNGFCGIPWYPDGPSQFSVGDWVSVRFLKTIKKELTQLEKNLISYRTRPNVYISPWEPFYLRNLGFVWVSLVLVRFKWPWNMEYKNSVTANETNMEIQQSYLYHNGTVFWHLYQQMCFPCPTGFSIATFVSRRVVDDSWILQKCYLNISTLGWIL